MNQSLDTKEFARLNATIPKQLNKFASARVKSGAFSNRSEYVRHLIRQDMESVRKNDIDYINSILHKSKESGLSTKTPKKRNEDIAKIVQQATSG